MDKPPKSNSHLWNDLPFEERKRLMPYMLEAQILHVWQCKEKAIKAHKRHLQGLNDLIGNLERELNKIQ